MADPAPAPAPAPDLQALQAAAATAAQARQDQFNLYLQARTAQDLNGLSLHYQGYQTALQVEQKANEALAGNILNTPAIAQDLALLAKANQNLAAAAANLKTANADIAAFTSAANVVVQILGTLAII